MLCENKHIVTHVMIRQSFAALLSQYTDC